MPDADNRLVARELEHRWNERLKQQQAIEEDLEGLRQSQSSVLSAAEQDELLRLGEDLTRTWHHPQASVEIRKRILRTLLKEIMVWTKDDVVSMMLHWHGGDHTELVFERNKAGEHRWTTSADTVTLIQQLARLLPDAAIAALLNRLGKRTAHGHTWTAVRVCSLRSDHAIEVYREGERAQRDELTLEEAAATTGVSRMALLRLIRAKALPAGQACKGAPWIIRKADLQSPIVQALLRGGPRTTHPDQLGLDYQ